MYFCLVSLWIGRQGGFDSFFSWATLSVPLYPCRGYVPANKPLNVYLSSFQCSLLPGLTCQIPIGVALLHPLPALGRLHLGGGGVCNIVLRTTLTIFQFTSKGIVYFSKTVTACIVTTSFYQKNSDSCFYEATRFICLHI